jgi:hypothetical protein
MLFVINQAKYTLINIKNIATMTTEFLFLTVVGGIGIEPMTFATSMRRSSQLS